MTAKEPIYGILAEFEEKSSLLEAARRAYEEGYRRMDAYSPFPIEGLAELLGHRRSFLPWLVLGGGISGGVLGYALQYYLSALHYPLNVGGRPLHSWPAFIPVTFELTILGGALTAVFGMLALNRLPTPYHPLFAVAGFELATSSRFFLCIEASDPSFDPERTLEFLRGLGPRRAVEVAC
ncbi:MAG: DUF3341 domain-containing protein [Vicinamibacteria bacterium]